MTLEAQLVSCPECGDDRLRLVEGVLECRACGAEVVGAGLVGAPASSEPPVGRVSFLDEAPSNLRVRQNDRAASAKWRLDEKTGFLHAEVGLTRSGVFYYQLADGRVVGQLRHPDEVKKAAHLASIERAVATKGHPSKSVSTANVRALGVGHLGDSIRIEEADGEVVLVANVTVTDAATVKDILERGLTAVSLGYDATLVVDEGVWPTSGEKYQLRQLDPEVNHVAVAIAAGRAGPVAKVRVGDELGPGALASGSTEDPGAKPAKPTRTATKDRKTMPRVRLNDRLEIEVEDTGTASSIINALEARDRDLATAAATIKAKDEALAKVEAQRDELTKKVEAATKAGPAVDDVAKATKERVAVIFDAALVVDLSDPKVLAEVAASTPAEIRKAVVLAVCADEAPQLADKGDGYFEVRYDMIMSETKKRLADARGSGGVSPGFVAAGAAALGASYSPGPTRPGGERQSLEVAINGGPASHFDALDVATASGTPGVYRPQPTPGM